MSALQKRQEENELRREVVQAKLNATKERLDSIQAKLRMANQRLAGMERPPLKIDAKGGIAWLIPSPDRDQVSTTFVIPEASFGREPLPTWDEFCRLVSAHEPKDGELELVDLHTLCYQIPEVTSYENFRDPLIVNAKFTLYSAREEHLECRVE